MKHNLQALYYTLKAICLPWLSIGPVEEPLPKVVIEPIYLESSGLLSIGNLTYDSDIGPTVNLMISNVVFTRTDECEIINGILHTIYREQV